MQSIKPNLSTELKVWEKIRLIVGEGREAGVYEARIEDIINGGVIITDPEFVSGHTLLRNGVTTAVQITREDAVYQFNSQVRSQPSGSSTKRVVLSPPKGFRRIQRRMFARVELSVKVTYALLNTDTDWTDWQQNFTWHKTYTSNISGGGILLKLSEPVPTQSLIALRINTFREVGLPEVMIARCCRKFDAEGQQYAGMKYLMVEELGELYTRSILNQMPQAVKQFDNRTQDRLVTFLFQKQIELRQKGLI